jgi:hypothetical protein
MSQYAPFDSVRLRVVLFATDGSNMGSNDVELKRLVGTTRWENATSTAIQITRKGAFAGFRLACPVESNFLTPLIKDSGSNYGRYFNWGDWTNYYPGGISWESNFFIDQWEKDRLMRTK